MSNPDMAAEISNYSDSVLRAKLMEAGVNPGPIVGSTRALYEKKLLGFIKAANSDRISPKQRRRSSPQKPSPHSSFTASPISVGGASPYSPSTGTGLTDIPIDGLSGDAIRGNLNSSTPSVFARHAAANSSGGGGLYPRLDELSSLDQGGLSVSGRSVEHFSTTTSKFGGERYGGPAGMSHLMEEGVQDFVKQSDSNQDGYGTGGDDSDDMRGEEVFIKHTPSPDRGRPKPYLRPSAASSSAAADAFGRQPSWERTTVTTPRLATPRVYSATNPLDARLAAPSYPGREERHPMGGAAGRQEVTGRLVNPLQVSAGISYMKLGFGLFGVVVGVIFMVMLVRRFVEMRAGKQLGDDWEG